MGLHQVEVVFDRPPIIAVVHRRDEAGRVERGIEAVELVAVGPAKALKEAFALVPLGVRASEGVGGKEYEVAALASRRHKAAARERHAYPDLRRRVGHGRLTLRAARH